ncbi:carbon-nitrogen hydrolase family protein [Vibrio panuliri]|uniref:CN hydrolase domain-containing protein n=1 Tax=Vibrio panuliri TaxID=1381081 RepID=A0ABX3FP27_9VIBR|nr:carbon-nitrogen hydrolase family protein [Vibrio panuliri]KAB1457620.1 carbon-nitrogen hydrolase family protein [Vibrio panuliri]OLQ95974.1 hypothetical protein BIY20_20440 [Vibrio panuliri]
MNSNSLLIALAQVPIEDGEIEVNLRQHLHAINQAATLGADIVVFPELSLSGYQISRADELSLEAKHSVLRDLSDAAVTHQITVIAGCFLKRGKNKPAISAAICKPTGELDFYAKQYLHGDEKKYCRAGQHNYYLRIKGYKLALAICADFTHPLHSSEADEDEADVYLVSALISTKGYADDSEILSQIARKHRFPVLLSNYIKPTAGWQVAGNSAVWDQEGVNIFTASSEQADLSLIDITGHVISGKSYPIERKE